MKNKKRQALEKNLLVAIKNVVQDQKTCFTKKAEKSIKKSIKKIAKKADKMDKRKLKDVKLPPVKAKVVKQPVKAKTVKKPVRSKLVKQPVKAKQPIKIIEVKQPDKSKNNIEQLSKTAN